MKDLFKVAKERKMSDERGSLAKLISDATVHLDRCGVCSSIAYVNNIDHVCWDCKAWLEMINERTG